jgi:hypothetical protein
MASFVVGDENTLDYAVIRDGGITIYRDFRFLEEDIQWLRESSYRIHRVDCADWVSENALHESLKTALAFPDYYGKNLNALNDVISDLDVPDVGGVALVLSAYDFYANGAGASLSGSSGTGKIRIAALFDPPPWFRKVLWPDLIRGSAEARSAFRRFVGSDGGSPCFHPHRVDDCVLSLGWNLDRDASFRLNPSGKSIKHVPPSQNLRRPALLVAAKRTDPQQLTPFRPMTCSLPGAYEYSSEIGPQKRASALRPLRGLQRPNLPNGDPGTISHPLCVQFDPRLVRLFVGFLCTFKLRAVWHHRFRGPPVRRPSAQAAVLHFGCLVFE